MIIHFQEIGVRTEAGWDPSRVSHFSSYDISFICIVYRFLQQTKQYQQEVEELSEFL